MAAYSRLICKRKFRLIYTKHNSIPVQGCLSRWRFLRINHAAIFVSRSIFRSIGFPVKARNVYIVRNGVDTQRWLPPQRPTGGTVIRLLSIAGTSQYKGWHYLIAALKLLPETTRARFSVVIAGHLPSAELLQQLCHGDYLPQQVRFSGFLSQPERAVTDADIGFVLSDSIETISFACREMMSAGLPVIVSDFGGLAENITEAQDGWVLPVRDVNALAGLLQRISRMQPVELDAMKQQARRKAEDEFDVGRMRDQTHQIYQHLIR